MLKRLTLAAFLLAPLPALADTITVQIVSTVPGASGTLTRSMTLTQADTGSFIAGLEAATQMPGQLVQRQTSAPATR